jgi:hypothetical protein
MGIIRQQRYWTYEMSIQCSSSTGAGAERQITDERLLLPDLRLVSLLNNNRTEAWEKHVFLR